MPFAESRRAFTQINRDVKDQSFHDADQLSLRVRGDLVVEAADHPFFGTAVIVLDELGDQAVFGKSPGMVGFHEKAAVVGKGAAFNNDDAGQRGFAELKVDH